MNDAVSDRANDSRPSSQNARDQLVVEVRGYPLAGKVLHVRVFHVTAGSPGSTPSSPLPSTRSSISESGGKESTAQNSFGFRILATDELDNDFSLFVPRQKAEYLAASQRKNSEEVSTSLSLEQIGNSILDQLDIIGNRNRDIGKLICREPEIHVTKRTRGVPTRSAGSKQRNPHLIGKQNDQRAVRAKKNALKAMAAIASAHEQDAGMLSSQDTVEPQEMLQTPSRRSRKASDDSLLHRMAFSSEKPTWKSNLATSLEEEHQNSVVPSHDIPSKSTTSLSSNPNSSSATSTLGPKRVIPERKHKHKDLYERRAKERNQRLLITRAKSSSNIMDSSLISPKDTPLTTLTVAEAMVEEDDQTKVNSPSNSKAIRERFNAAVRNAFVVRTFLGVKDPVEPEQFLRRRAPNRGERRVLKDLEAFSDFPGMGIEITHERPEGRYGIDASDPMVQEKLRILTQAARRSSIVRDKDGNLVRRSNSSRGNSFRRSSNALSPDISGLAESSSAPEIRIPAFPQVDNDYEGELHSGDQQKDIAQKQPLSPNNFFASPVVIDESSNRSGLFSVTNSDTERLPEFSNDNSIEPQDEQVMLPSKSLDPEVVFEPCLVEPSQVDSEDKYEPKVVALSARTPKEPNCEENLNVNPPIINIAHLVGQNTPAETPRTHLSPIQPTARRQVCWNDLNLPVGSEYENTEGKRDVPRTPSETEPSSPTERSRPKSASDPIPVRLEPLKLDPQNIKEHVQISPVELNALSSTTNVQIPCEEGQNEGISPTLMDDGNQDKTSSVLRSDRQYLHETAGFDVPLKESIDARTTISARKYSNGNFAPIPSSHSEATPLNTTESLSFGKPNKSIASDLAAEEPRTFTVTQPASLTSTEPPSFQNSFDSEKMAVDQIMEEGEERIAAGSRRPSVTDDQITAIAAAASAAVMASTESPSIVSKATLRQKHPTESRSGLITTDTSNKQFSVSSSSTQRGGPLLPRDPVQSPSKRRSSVFRLQSNHLLDDHRHGSRRKSVVKAILPQLSTLTTPDTTVSSDTANSGGGSHGKPSEGGSVGSLKPKHQKSVGKSLALIPSSYHKTWSKWVNGKGLVEKINCLQLEENVLSDPHNGSVLVKLGLRYAKWSATSLAGILLLEHASALHESAPRTHEFWNSMGNAHLDLFLRNRKFLPAASFHLDRCIKSLTRAFAFMESMADPLLLLRFALCLFWHQEPGHLERADEIFQQLFTKFSSFCDKDRASLYFLRFQVLHRLGTFTEATGCIDKVIATVSSGMSQPKGSDAPNDRQIAFVNPVYDLSDYWMMKMQSQQASGDYVQATSTFSRVLEAKGLLQDGSLTDDQYFELWYGIAEKCFVLEDYALASEYYPIALNFAKDSHLLATIHYRLGLCFQALGNDQRCTAEFKRARNLNRHARPPVLVAELRGNYSEQFSELLQKPIRLVIEEVRVNLYDRAVRQLQRVFRRKHPSHAATRSALLISGELSDSKMPSLVARKLSGSPSRVRSASGSPRQSDLGVADSHDNESMESILESDADSGAKRQAEFEAKKRVALEQIESLRSGPTKDTRFPYLSLKPGVRASTQSELLSPEKDRPEVRRLRSMATYNHLGYLPTTAPCVEYWEKLLALSTSLFPTRRSVVRAVCSIRSLIPRISDEAAFCALADAIGDVDNAIERLRDPSYEREVSFICSVIDVEHLVEQALPVRLPTIVSPSRTSNLHTSNLASKARLTPRKSPASRLSQSSSFSSPRPLRLEQMLDLQFEQHVQSKIERVAPEIAPENPAEKFDVLGDFRQVNATLLPSQAPFGSEVDRTEATTRFGKS